MLKLYIDLIMNKIYFNPTFIFTDKTTLCRLKTNIIIPNVLEREKQKLLVSMLEKKYENIQIINSFDKFRIIIYTTGLAQCDLKDTYNANIGKRISESKATIKCASIIKRIIFDINEFIINCTNIYDCMYFKAVGVENNERGLLKKYNNEIKHI